MSRAGEQYQHAKERCRERCGFEIKRSQYQQLAEMIRNGQGRMLSDDQRISVWILRFKGQEIKAVYDLQTQKITTFLPLDE